MIVGINLFFPVASKLLIAKEGTDVQPSGTGLPARSLLHVLQHLRVDIAEIREAIAEVHMRMVGGSLLVVYEAGWERVEEGLKFLIEDDEDEMKRPGPPYIVQVIDFAHSHIVPGECPDEGVLKGIDTTLDLLDQPIRQVQAP